jgi:hypothetical protein
LTGIIYTHRISDIRPKHGSTLKQLQNFAGIYGEEGLPHIVLMTTMWSTVRPDEGLRWEGQLKSHNDLWLPLLNLGATISRFNNSYDSAWDIVETLEKKRDHRIKLQLPKEARVEIKKLNTSFVNQVLKKFRKLF